MCSKRQRKKDMVEKEGRSTFLPRPPPLDRSVYIGDEEKQLLQVSDQLIPVLALDAAMEGERALVTAGEIATVVLESTPSTQVQNDASNSTTTITKKKRLNFDLKGPLLLITFSMIPLTDILFLHGPTAKLTLRLKLSAFLAFTALTSSTCLMFHTCKLKAVVKPEKFITKSQLTTSKILYGIAVGSLILTCISITYSLLPKAYYFLPLALLPSLPVAGFHFLHGEDTDSGEITPAQLKAAKKELKRATQLTMSLVSTSFSGFFGVLLAIYHKAGSLGTAYSYIKATVYLLLGGSVAGMSALLLCRLLSRSSNDNQRQELGTWERAILAAANIVMLVMLMPAVLMIAETILHGLLVGAVFPVIAGAAAWLLVEFCSVAEADGGGCADEDGKAAHGTMYAIAVAVASLSFGAILAIFGGLLGGTVSKEQLKACTFLLASAFVAAVSLGVVTTTTAGTAAARADRTKVSTEFAATVLACCGLGTLVLAALALFYQIVA